MIDKKMGLMLSVLIATIVGISLLPTVANEAEGVTNPTNATGSPITSNLTGASNSIVGLIPLIYIASLIVALVGMNGMQKFFGK